MSEVKRGLIRITSNFSRLGLQMVIGLVVVRMVLEQTGREGWSLVALLGAGIGFAAMFQEIIRGSMIREVGSAYHSGDEKLFLEAYNSAFAVSAAAAAAATLTFGGVALLLPSTGMEGAMLATARWFVLAKVIQTLITITLAPTHNMYLVTERMVFANTLMLMERVVMVLGALPLYFVDTTVETKLLIYAWATTGLTIAVYLIASAHLMLGDRRLRPRLGCITRGGIRSVVTVGGWNMLVSVADSLHLRLDHWLLSILMGYDPWSALFGYGRLIAGYIYQLGVGVAGGVDAVAARMAAMGDIAALRKLVHHSTRLHAMVAAPALVGVVVLAQPIIGVWVGDQMDDPAHDLPLAASLTRVLAIGFAARAVAQGWFRIFYGSGHVHLYAPILVLSGVANPFLSLTLYWALPEQIRHTCVAWAYSLLIVTAAIILIPMRVAPQIGLRARDLYLPLVRPSVVAIVCCPILLVGQRWISDWNVWSLALVGGAYAGVYAPGCLIFAIRPHERRRLVNTLGRRRSTQAGDAPDA